jgi:hypothetical protein
MSKKHPNARPHGQLRQSQVVTTFGPGSMLDLPSCSALVGGLDDWARVGDEVHETRLVEKLRRLLDVPALKLYAPPPDTEEPGAPGIRAWQFPQWFITQDVEFGPGGVRTRALVHSKMLTGGRYVDQSRKKRPVVPVRFVRACRRGHIGDIDWRYFTHRGKASCARPPG